MLYISNETLNFGLGTRMLKAIVLMAYVEHISESVEPSKFLLNRFANESRRSLKGSQLNEYYHTRNIDYYTKYLDICGKWDAMFSDKVEIENIIN